jgi:hypothetical protein
MNESNPKLAMFYRVKKMMNKLWGRQKAFDIALGRKIFKILDKNYSRDEK